MQPRKLADGGATFASQKLTNNGIVTIWDDRILNRAYEVLGGKPKVILQAANDAVPEDLKKRLGEMVT